MISVIICRSKKNANLICDIPNESHIEKIDYLNEKNESIFHIYQKLISSCSHEYVLFLHDDVKIQTENWIQKLIESLQKYDIVGIAGSKYLSSVPSSWFTNGEEEMSLIQHYNDSNIKHHIIKFSSEDKYENVVAIDGVFMAFRKNVLNSLKFEQKKYTAFHYYDLDISMQALIKGYKIGVTKDILIEHFSSGKLDENWAHSAIFFTYTYQKYLPISIAEYKIKPHQLNKDWWIFFNFLKQNYKCIKREEVKMLNAIFFNTKSVFSLGFLKTFFLLIKLNIHCPN